MFIKVWIVICVGIFLIKILLDIKTENMLDFALGLSFMFGTYVAHCFCLIFCGKKRQK